MEELFEDSDIDTLYYELMEYLDMEGLPIQYVSNLDLDDIEISDELKEFIDSIEGINYGYRYLGVEASDIKPDNMGYSSDGVLKAFDIDNKQLNR